MLLFDLASCRADVAKAALAHTYVAQLAERFADGLHVALNGG